MNVRRGALLALTLALMLSGCRPLVADEPKTLTFYATFYPIYALASALTKDVPDLTLHCLVQPQDGCLRSYQLSDWDVRLLASGADAVLMGGRGLESFESALFSWGEGGPAMSAVLYNLDLYTPKNAHAQSAEDSHLEGPNPHLYMSVDGAKRILQALSGALIALDPRYGDRYAANEAAALSALDALSARVQEIAGEVSGKKVVLMNEALIYVARDYGLEVADWIDRESGAAYYELEMKQCLKRLDRSGARVVLIEKQAPAALTEALAEAGYAVAKLDILSTHREEEGFEGYIKAQQDNAEAVLRAFREVER